MKKFLGFMTAVMMLFVISSFSVSADDVKRMYLTNVVCMGGGEVEVDLKFETDNTCVAYDVLVRYDERLELNKVATEQSLQHDKFIGEGGEHYVSLVGYHIEPFEDNVAAATLFFKVPEIYKGIECYDVDIEIITTFGDDHSDFELVKKENSNIINLPSESETKVYFNEVGVAEYGVRGDINGDDTTNVRDAAAIAKYCATSNMELSKAAECYADYNNDTQVNVRDAAAISKTLAKSIK